MTNRTKIIAVGINNYHRLKKLSGPIKDVEKFENLLCKDQSTALFSPASFTKLIDITIERLRTEITEYAVSRTAQNDILIFYFSGHATCIGNHDLGLCLIDSTFHLEYKKAISLSVLRFSDIIETISAVNVDPIIIIDACYSGQAGEKIEIVNSELKRTIQADTGSNYALLCSSRNTDQSIDTYNGGFFSNILFEIAKQGLDQADKIHNEELSLKDLYQKLRNKIETDSFDTIPQLFIGDTLPQVGFVKNTKFKPIETLFHKSFIDILKKFWNDGSPKELSTKELQPLGSTIHTTYSKLSYEPAWGLLIKPKRGKARLTDKGIQFIRGEISIPYSISKDIHSNKYFPTNQTKKVRFDDFK
jgi:hypothetical protein